MVNRPLNPFLERWPSGFFSSGGTGVLCLIRKCDKRQKCYVISSYLPKSSSVELPGECAGWR